MIDIKEILEELKQNITHNKQELFRKLVEARLNKCLDSYHKTLQKAYNSLELRAVVNPKRETKRVWKD